MILTRLRTLSCLFLALLIAASILPARDAGANVKCEAAAFVKSAGDAYDRAASSGSPTSFASAASRFTDLRQLSLFALGRFRKDLPKAREAEYFSLTRKFIGGFMLDYGKGFKASSLEITDCKTSGSNLIVNARLSTGGKVIFRVSKSGGYSITDINMKGIWLAQQLRSTFVGTMTRDGGGIDALFKYLKS